MATKTKIFFVMEYVGGGELFAKLAKGKLKEDLAHKYFQQLISAVDVCHSRGVSHRDLKPENLLLDEYENLKISDFGLSALPEQLRCDGLLHTQCGTRAYVAPEVLRKKGMMDATVLKDADLYEWLKGRNSDEAGVVGIGLPSYSFFQSLLFSIKSNSNGFLLMDGIEITYLNRPKDKLLDWFFKPVMVLKEQIRVVKLDEYEIRYLEKLVLFGSKSSNTQRLEAWDNG